mmetsp:Transcript_25555/g.22578  ORF Transcript_25555/g.22578 Transcript_25555/m.22578 type:complete len:527 (+) Transcript_25555:25-1605(+)
MNSKIDELIKQSESYDQDHRFMAANDLCTELLKPNNNLDNKSVERIIQVFIRQLDDSTADIKGNAIKCLAKVVSKIPENLISEVCKKLITNINNPQKKEDIKNIDIYATCLKTLINEIPEHYADIMCKTLVQAGLTKRTDTAEINEELIELTNHLLKRFSSFLYKNSNIFNKDALIKDLLKNIKDERSSLRKKASLCLGSLSNILSTKEISSVGEVLINSMIANAQKKELLYFTIGFNSIVKNIASKLGNSVTTILPFIIKDINQRRDNQDEDDFEFTNEIIDYHLSIIDYFIKMCPVQTKPFLKDVINTIYHLISYDPNSAVDDDEEEAMEPEEEEEEEDGYDDFDDMYDNDDTSWKVRRAAVQVADTMIQTHPELLRDLAETIFDKLVKRFKENEQNVKLDVFHALSNFLKMIVYGDKHDDDNLEELIEMPKLTKMKSAFMDYSSKISGMVASLSKVFKDKKSTPALKIAASNLLFKASKCTPDAVVDKFDVVFPLLEQHYSNSSNPTELKVNLLKVLRSLLKA